MKGDLRGLIGIGDVVRHYYANDTILSDVLGVHKDYIEVASHSIDYEADVKGVDIVAVYELKEMK